ncbi:unnamed protein product [Caenorhabditis auriculariae]|uniref:Major facilitator superfamily (MFS) profile domain-containing protein n=1 Tax=Caenorhabditis auriculariae TaxID=2777116 RepID=A0A8S1HM12_9PELO|nr:unnamed protein product [Caenorhabditis auriculariae]
MAVTPPISDDISLPAEAPQAISVSLRFSKREIYVPVSLDVVLMRRHISDDTSRLALVSLEQTNFVSEIRNLVLTAMCHFLCYFSHCFQEKDIAKCWEYGRRKTGGGLSKQNCGRNEEIGHPIAFADPHFRTFFAMNRIVAFRNDARRSHIRYDQLMPSISIHVLSVALCLSAGYQQGYIASVLNQPYAQIEQYINQSWIERTGDPISGNTLHLLWSLLNVCFPIATIFGQFLAGFMCSRLGRKKTALIASFFYIPGSLCCASAKWLSPAFELLFVGRIIWSLANGINSVNATVWIVECAPPQFRGRMAAMQEFFMALGSLTTQAVGVPFSTDELWPFNFLPNIVVVLASLVMFTYVSESPQFIMERYNDIDRARKALAAYHGVSEDDPSVDAEIRICEDSLTKKKGVVKAKSSGIECAHSPMAVMFMPWKANDATSKIIRHCVWVGVMVKIGYVFTGARCLRSYSTFILFTMSHWKYSQATWLSFLIGLIRVPVTLMPVFLVDRLGRRPLIVVSMFVSFASLLLMMLAINMGGEWKYATFCGLTGLLLINTCGIGSVSRFYSAELVPRDLLLSSVSTLNNFESLTKIAVEFAFYPLANVIGAQSLLLFIVPTGVFFFLTWSLCPETSRKTVNEVLNNVASKKKLDVYFPM